MKKGRPRRSNRRGEPTDMQRMAVNLIVSGQAKSVHQAMKKAGYSKHSAMHKKQDFIMRHGVQTYLRRLDDRARMKWGMAVQDKIMDTYAEALDATKLYGKKAIEHPDHSVRIQAADRFSRFFKWTEEGIDDDKKQFNQFNFFNANPEQQKKFHDNLKHFIKESAIKINK
jgi:hypothetical protein